MILNDLNKTSKIKTLKFGEIPNLKSQFLINNILSTSIKISCAAQIMYLNCSIKSRYSHCTFLKKKSPTPDCNEAFKCTFHPRVKTLKAKQIKSASSKYMASAFINGTTFASMINQ